ncbi:MAG: amidophosphoribosyltransferase [Micavibrio sp.]|nr:amidophosphoribosyltransferase [Micavibrio sp.]|tara:strand:+ start:133677 stop:135131 length:1455 start_codon:yes stop_codon:yes gene_type:complete
MTQSENDKFRDECGVFAVFGHEDASSITALGLHALQHRGQEACGIVSYDQKMFYAKRAIGLVDDTFGQKSVIDYLSGSMAIGHNRYATSGEGHIRNVQPLYADLSFGGYSVAHNGNLTNSIQIRDKLVKGGSLFQSTSDTEIFIHLTALSKKESVEDKLIDGLKQVEGAYSLVAMCENKIIGVRDPHGLRPLVIGKLKGAYILASETVALDIIDAEFIREVAPGEMVILTEKGLVSRHDLAKKDSRFCIFEYVYFARPDSVIEGNSVYETRKKIGEELAKESHVEGADVVVPVPDSGVPSAIGYAQESGVPFELGIIRNHYVGRTFIEPTDQIRHLGVRLKHNANRHILEGKKVVLVDDSIVRGTTSKKIVEMVREAGAAEVHMRISSPPTKHSCFYGINTPSTEELMAHKYSVDEIAKQIGVDSLAYISVDGLYRATKAQNRNNKAPQYCDACFTGEYMIPLTDYENKKTGAKVTQLRERAKN